ncbi:MAG: hypothetical protein WDZ63_06230 [Burkholderiales bacterium]
MALQMANRELTPGDVPSFREPWARIEPFALTFDGYRYWGSIEECARVACRTPGSLTELRTCLFFEARRWKHLGRAPDVTTMKRIRAIVFAIQEKVKIGDLR